MVPTNENGWGRTPTATVRGAQFHIRVVIDPAGILQAVRMGDMRTFVEKWKCEKCQWGY